MALAKPWDTSSYLAMKQVSLGENGLTVVFENDDRITIAYERLKLTYQGQPAQVGNPKKAIVRISDSKTVITIVTEFGLALTVSGVTIRMAFDPEFSAYWLEKAKTQTPQRRIS